MVSKRLGLPRLGAAVLSMAGTGIALLAAAPGAAAEEAPAEVVHRIAAPEARQGVASDGKHVFAIDNNVIAKYRIADDKRLAEWRGDPAQFPHINSCTIASRELVCAASN